MHKWYFTVGWLCALVASIIGTLAYASPEESSQLSNVVISDVQTRDAASSFDEFVVIANNSQVPVDVTNWCLKYTSTSGATKTLACLTPADPATSDILPVGGIAVFASTQEMSTLPPGTPVDGTFSATLNNDTGLVRIYDATGVGGDMVDWGSTALAGYSGDITAGQLIERLPATDGVHVFQDTDSVGDFALIPFSGFPTSSLTFIHDLCLSLAGVQTEIPPGDSADGSGNCSPIVDVCLNIDGAQAELPPGLEFDDAGNCLPVADVSPPDGTPTGGSGDTTPPDDNSDPAGDANGDSNDTGTSANTGDSAPPTPPAAPYVTELLPNPPGSDKGAEFVEIYNPNDTAVDLSSYVLKIGATLNTTVAIPAGTILAANSYAAIYNSASSYTLVNSAGAAGVLGSIASDVYGAAPEGEAWALIGGVWQWTNQPTPGAANAPSTVDDADNTTTAQAAHLSPVATLKPCAANQYRNPVTNRCKLIAATASGSSLTPCAADEERNPDTNRCRKITSASSSAPTPCKANQQRNPATNRCKNIVAMPTSTDYKVLGAKISKDGHVYIWWIIGGVVAAGAGYAAWEWHEEIARGMKWAWARVKRTIGK